MAEIILQEGSAPSTPTSGRVSLYAKTDGLLYFKDDGGTEHSLGYITSDLIISGFNTPAQITANVNDYNPGNLSTTAVLRLDSDASRNITGLAEGQAGKIIIIHYIGSNDVILKAEDAASTDINRFASSADITLATNDSALLQYDSVTSRWRIIAKPPAAGSGITTLNSQTGATQSFAKADDTNVTLTISSAGNVHTFTLGWTGTLALSRLVSASAESKLLGRGQGSGAGVYQEITLGTGLSMSGTTLSASGSGSSPLTTKGDIYTYDTADARLPVGTDGQLLSANSAAATGLAWATVGTLTDGDKGDITVSSSGTVWTIDAAVVTFAKIQNIATDRLLGRDTAGSGSAEELTVSGGVEFTGSAGIQRSALTGDVTASAGSNATTIANSAVTYAKMQNVSAANRLLGRSTAGAGVVEEISPSGDITQSGSSFTVVSASTTTAGKVELATTAETDTGTDTTRAVTPDGLAGSIFGTKTVGILVSDPNGDAITTGDEKAYVRIPSVMNGMNLVSVAAHVSTVSSSGTITIQIRNVTDTVDMLSTALTIDASEKDSATAAAPAVINAATDDVATADEISIDIDGAGTGAKGLYVELQFRLP